MSWQNDPVVDPKESSQWENDPVVEPPSTLESAGHAAVNNFPFGGQMAAKVKSFGNDKGYSGNLEDWNKQTEIDKSAHPVVYGAGAVGGAIAPLFFPGVGEALEAAPIAGNAVLGGVSAAGNTDLVKHPGEALQQGIEGMGIGGLTAGILGHVLPTGVGLANIAEKKGLQSLEMPGIGGMAPEERQGLYNFVKEKGLIGRDKTEVLEHARDLSKQFGSKIGEIGDEASNLGLDQESQLGHIDNLLKKSEQFKGSSNREAKALARDYTAGASDILNLSDNPSWNSIQKLKEQYGKLAFKSNGEIKSEGAKDTYFALKDMLKDIADKAQNSNLATEYKQALAGYSQMQPIESALEKSVNSEFQGGAGMGVRGMVGLIKKMPAPARAIAGPAAVAMGHPLLGLAAALPELTNPALQSKAASGMANLAGKLPELTPQAINQMLHDHLINESVHHYLMEQFKKVKE